MRAMSPLRRPATILVADDNADNVFVLESLLTHAGHSVLVARDGADALRQGILMHPDIVLLDLDMPIMNGWETGRRLKAQPETARVPIIAITAHALIGDQEAALRESCDEFIAKPFHHGEVLQIIERALDRSRGQRDAD
jgi:CheY-like chemotaxis protein